jgi:predicted acylesterase/phospholipase RssA
MTQSQETCEEGYPEYKREDFPVANLPFCDLVMKGGITSGVVYPLAICEIAKKRQLKSIGGTSAGAIAAAAAAAAEYGRQHQQGSGFVGMSELPSFLEGNLLGLFQATPSTEPLFELFIKLLSSESQSSKLMQVALTVINHFKACFLIGASPGLIFLTLIIYKFAWPVGLFGGICAVVLTLMGGLLGVIARLYTLFFKELPQNGFGMCSGKSQAQRGKNKQQALSDWLTDLLDKLSGLGKQSDGSYHPLTFGDLWGSPEGLEERQSRQINLEMMTTNLTHGEPLQLPSKKRSFYFSPEELKEIFPDEIVKWMVDHSPKQYPPDKLPVALNLNLYQLPFAQDLPIVVATRLSLSFPILLTAVPLYAINYRQAEPPKRIPQKCWFSDGGISSNFPIHFFDSLWPRWPTFAISLDTEDARHRTGSWLPKTYRDGIQPAWTSISSLTSFIGAIFSTAQNWRDTTQARLPGYRERIVHITLNSQEGGLNLKMSGPMICNLAYRGREAGKLLVEEFNWEAHRWVRYLSSTAEMESQFEAMQRSYNQDLGQSSLKEFLQFYPQSEGYRSYRVTQAWLSQARNMTDQWMEPHQPWFQKVFKQQSKIPNPRSELRITPRL